ncbi:hypothetical protein [Nonomuraea sp. NPDC002799]
MGVYGKFAAELTHLSYLSDELEGIGWVRANAADDGEVPMLLAWRSSGIRVQAKQRLKKWVFEWGRWPWYRVVVTNQGAAERLMWLVSL